MKHIKKFESFDEEETFDLGNYPVDNNREEEICEPCGYDEDDHSMPGGDWEEDELDIETEDDSFGDDEEEGDFRRRLWGDEQTVERLVVSFRQFEAKKQKPDFLDLDGDGDKKEPMKKAAKEAKNKKDKEAKNKKDKSSEKSQKKLKSLFVSGGSNTAAPEIVTSDPSTGCLRCGGEGCIKCVKDYGRPWYDKILSPGDNWTSRH